MALTQYLHTNNASSNLRDAITAVQLTLAVTSTHGTLFPLPAVNQAFFVTVEDRKAGRREIMLCTSRSGDTLTVQRGKQGTVPQSFVAGVNVSNRITAQILDEFVAATVNVVDIDRIPAIPSSKIVSLDAAKIVGPGKVALGQLPAIPSSQITSLDAAKLTGTIDPLRLPATIPAANLPTIPSSKITAVAGEAITTGTIAVARIPILSSAKISDLDAAKLTGTIAEARMPAAFDIAGGMTARNLIITGSPGNASIVGYLNVGGVVTADKVVAQLQHPNHGGYVNIGAYSSTYGSGYGTYYWNDTDNKFVFNGGVHATSGFIGSGSGLTGVVNSNVGVEQGTLLLGPLDGHGAGSIYNGSSLATPYFRVDNSSTDLTISYGSGPSGKWRAMSGGAAGSNERCLGFFVRTE